MLHALKGNKNGLIRNERMFQDPDTRYNVRIPSFRLHPGSVTALEREYVLPYVLT